MSLVDGQVSSEEGLASIYFNGTRGNQHNLTIDGSSNVQVAGNNLVHVTINPDAVAEVRVLTANYQAEYGRSAGGFIQFVTQSGGKDFHGSARLFHRHEGLNANNYFRNAEGRNSNGEEIQPRPLYRYNYTGYDIGGPVPLGAWNRNRDKLFFFWNQEFYRQLEPAFARNIRVPTEAERRGDFSETVDGNGNKIFIRDPNMSRQLHRGCPNGVLPGQHHSARPLFRGWARDTESISTSKRFPDRTSSITRRRFRTTFRGARTFFAWTTTSASEHASASVTFTTRPPRTQPYTAGGNFQLSKVVRTVTGRNGAISLWHSFSPTLTNEFIFGPSTSDLSSGPEDEKATRRANKITFPLLFPDANPKRLYSGLFVWWHRQHPQAFPRLGTSMPRPPATGAIHLISPTTSRRFGNRIRSRPVYICSEAD